MYCSMLKSLNLVLQKSQPEPRGKIEIVDITEKWHKFSQLIKEQYEHKEINSVRNSISSMKPEGLGFTQRMNTKPLSS